MGRPGRCWMLRVARASSIAALSLAIGCSGFFVYPGSTGTGTGGTSSTGDYVYIANASTNNLAGFAVGTSSLTAVANSPYALSVSPVALAINPANTLLYVAGGAAIYAFSIQSTGVLSALNGASPVAAATVESMDISPDGQWLLALDQSGSAIDEYKINASTGGLSSSVVTYSVSGTVVPRAIRIAPSAQFVFVALGTAGDLVFSFNTGTGQLSAPLALGESANQSDNALAVDPNSAYLYIARSGTGGGLAVYSIGLGGGLSEVAGSPFAAGTQPFSVVLNKAGTDVYVANQSDSTISGYSIGLGGQLTALSGSPYPAGSLVTALAVDNSGNYLLAAARNGSPDLELFSFDATPAGKLDAAASTATGTPTPTQAVAASPPTHWDAVAGSDRATAAASTRATAAPALPVVSSNLLPEDRLFGRYAHSPMLRPSGFFLGFRPKSRPVAVLAAALLCVAGLAGCSHFHAKSSAQYVYVTAKETSCATASRRFPTASPP